MPEELEYEEPNVALCCLSLVDWTCLGSMGCWDCKMILGICYSCWNFLPDFLADLSLVNGRKNPNQNRDLLYGK